MDERVRGGVTETPGAEPSEGLVLTEAERTWVQHQYQKEIGQTSRYIRHQGQRERARRSKKGRL